MRFLLCREDNLVAIQNCPAPHTESMLKPTPRVHRSETHDVSELTVRTLFDAEERALLRYAFSLLGRRAVAEEIVQEVFLQLHIHWAEIQSPRAWLFRSVRNRVFNHVRDNRREVLCKDDNDAASDGCVNETPEGLFLRLEAAGTLRQLLDDLNETDRQLVKLKYFEGMKYREISEQTGLTISNVGYRLHHILKELAGKLRPLGIDEIS